MHVLALGSEYRSGADSPRGLDHGQSDGARVPPPRWSGPQGAIGSSRRIAPVSRGYAVFGPPPGGHATFRYAPLRATAGVLLKNRIRKVQGAQRCVTSGTRDILGRPPECPTVSY